MQETFGLVRSGLDRGSTGVNESEVPKPEHKPIKPSKSQSEPNTSLSARPCKRNLCFFYTAMQIAIPDVCLTFLGTEMIDSAKVTKHQQ